MKHVTLSFGMLFQRGLVVAVLGGACIFAACTNGLIRTDDAPAIPDGSSPPPDASADAGVHDADGGSFCQRRSTSGFGRRFCADFDEVSTASDGWSLTQLEDGGSIALDDTLFLSPPRSARFETPAHPDGGTSAIWLLREVGEVVPAWWTVSFAYSVRIEDLGGSEVQLSSFILGPPAARSVFSFRVSPAGASLVTVREAPGDAAGYSESRAATRSPQQGAWVRVRFDIRFGSADSLTVTVDGQEAIAQHSLASDIVEGRMAVQLGASNVQGGQTPALVRFDDVEVLATHEVR